MKVALERMSDVKAVLNRFSWQWGFIWWENGLEGAKSAKDIDAN